MNTPGPGSIPAGGRFSLCGPALAGTAVGAVTGLAVWALVSFIPAFRNGVPEPVTDVLPFALAWTGHTLTAWITPHQAAPAAVIPPVTESGPVVPRAASAAGQVTWMRDQITSGITGTEHEDALRPDTERRPRPGKPPHETP
jgi:hypothetical protein